MFKSITIAALAAAILTAGVSTASAQIFLNGPEGWPNGVSLNGGPGWPNGGSEQGRDTSGGRTATGTVLINIELPSAQ